MSTFDDELGLDFIRGLEGQTEDRPVKARWATKREILSPNWLFGSQRGMMFLGYRDGVRIGRADDRHQITIGGTRGFKGVSLIIPTLATYEGSVLAIDPKGELAKVTAKTRRQRLGQKTIVLDPFEQTGITSNKFNPLDEIPEHLSDRPGEVYPTAIDDAMGIADAMITVNARDPHWSEGAKLLLQGLILLVLTVEKPERNLLTVRNLLTLKDSGIKGHALHEKIESLEAALFHMMQTVYADVFDGQIAAIGAQFAALSDKERSAVVSEARTQTIWLDSKKLVPVMASSDFALEDLKLNPTTLYLCLPASHMGTHARWLRIIITLALRACERVAVVPPAPVLFVLDEFHVLGHMKIIETAAGLMAGYGVKLWTILQDVGQLSTAYEKGWETFFGNSGIATFQSLNDQKSIEYLSKRLGSRSFNMTMTTGANFSEVSEGRRTSQENVQLHPLAAPHELEFGLARERRRMVVLMPGSHPILLERAIYHNDTFFKELLR